MVDGVVVVSVLQALNTEDYRELIDYYTAVAIERIEAEIDNTHDKDTLSEETPAIVESTVAHTKVEDGDDYRRGTFAGDHVMKSRNWADNDHSFVFFASMLDADRELFTNIDGREIDCEAWRTNWRWFADEDRFDHTKDKNSGPIRISDDGFQMPNSPFRAVRTIVFGLVCARVFDRVVDHYVTEIEQAEQEDTQASA